MPEWWMILLGLVAAWFIIDMTARIYLIYAPWETYKDDTTEDDHARYHEEKEAEAVEILSRYRWGRWLLRGRE